MPWADDPVIAGIMRLFGSSTAEASPTSEFIPAQPVTEYPSADDAAYAKQFGVGYGTGREPFINGDVARVTSTRGKAGVRGMSASSVMTAADSVPMTPGTDVTADAYARAELAANRSALVALGIDPRKAILDDQLKADNVNILGLYGNKSDRIYANADFPSALAHESIHRALSLLRKVYGNDAIVPDDDEELFVRYYMRTRLGDPEAALDGDLSSALRFQGGEWGKNPANRKFLDQMEQLAADQVAKRRPGGPR